MTDGRPNWLIGFFTGYGIALLSVSKDKSIMLFGLGLVVISLGAMGMWDNQINWIKERFQDAV